MRPLLPTVRAQIDDAAARRVRPARGSRMRGISTRTGAMLATGVAVALAFLALLHTSPPRRAGSHTTSGASLDVAAASILTPATPAQLRRATDLSWSSALTNTLP
jgi:hypothetical protein